MPVFDFGDWPNVIAAVPGFPILATMCYPSKRKLVQREELHATLVAEFFLEAADNPTALQHPLSHRDVLPLLRARHQGRAAKAVFQAVKLTNYKGHIAGDVLGLLRWLQYHGHPSSVLKACPIQAELGVSA